MKYYVTKKNALGQSQVLKQPLADMDGVIVIDLPVGDYFKVISSDKTYPVSKIVLAIAKKQLDINDIIVAV
ncbi:MAG: hypothetical protein GY931_06990 [Maribacter sp.]|nr:hypothetical protein [Maribacter sp.]